MRKLARSRKGVSLVMGTLMLVIVTMVAGIMFYQFVMGYVSSMDDNLSTQMSIVLLDTYNMNATCITAFVRNSGQYSIEILNAYVNCEIARLYQTVKIAGNSLAAAYIKGSFAQGITYTIKLAGMFGTLITFQVEYH